MPYDSMPVTFPSQADSARTTRKYGGSGLGLVIAQNLARLMGGDLTAVSRKGEGSTFTFTMPAKAIPQGFVQEASAGRWRVWLRACVGAIVVRFTMPAKAMPRGFVWLTDANRIDPNAASLCRWGSGQQSGYESVDARNGSQ
jgi:hypothetical protein